MLSPKAILALLGIIAAIASLFFGGHAMLAAGCVFVGVAVLVP